MAADAVHYIPAGSISISTEDQQSILDSWGPDDGVSWRWILVLDGNGEDDGSSHSTTSHHCIIVDPQQPFLKPFNSISLKGLLQHRWIRLQALRASHGLFWRVYLLPDDKLRGKIDRSDSARLKHRHDLLRVLDYSQEAWEGQWVPVPNNPILLGDQDADTDDMSLLEMFNRIPSPNPDPSLLSDPEAVSCMNSLLNGHVEGLATELYPYQQRSAALMLQKEAQPGILVDPRLLHIRDCCGGHWYLDPAAGTVLSEARLYDGISGGILAEEMGSGKTIICLALISATRLMQMKVPDIHGVAAPRRRPKIASLMDMAAASANRNGVPWRYLFEEYRTQYGFDHENCTKVLDDVENYGYYVIPAPKPRRCGRRADIYPDLPPVKVYLSNASLVVVPNNLLSQWATEIRQHTQGLRVLHMSREDSIPPAVEIVKYDIVLFSQSRFEMEVRLHIDTSPLCRVHFRRCIVDEGHKLGNSRLSSRSLLLTGLDALHVSSRWIVTGTPSHGLFGVKAVGDDVGGVDGADNESGDDEAGETPIKPDKLSTNIDVTHSSNELERKDLERIGAITALYLKARPWANTLLDTVDTVANWNTYLMLPKHGSRSQGRQECLRSTLNSLIIRHRRDEIGDLLPPVTEKNVVLQGSWYDQLSLNIFSMMIIFNAVQSQRTDQDYFFHPKQKQSLLQIVKNLKMSTFFGASFFTSPEITKSVETAEEFLREKKVPIDDQDEALLENALSLGRVAMADTLRHLSNQFHELPVSVGGFPGLGNSSNWGLEGTGSGDTICTTATLLLTLQKTIYDASAKPEALNALLNGGLELKGLQERQHMGQVAEQEASGKKQQTLAGNTKLGDAMAVKSRGHGVNNLTPMANSSSSLEPTVVTATMSAKLSYLLDSIVRYQDEEKMIVFYEHENTAWHIASMLDVVSCCLVTREAEFANC